MCGFLVADVAVMVNLIGLLVRNRALAEDWQVWVMDNRHW